MTFYKTNMQTSLFDHTVSIYMNILTASGLLLILSTAMNIIMQMEILLVRPIANILDLHYVNK